MQQFYVHEIIFLISEVHAPVMNNKNKKFKKQSFGLLKGEKTGNFETRVHLTILISNNGSTDQKSGKR